MEAEAVFTWEGVHTVHVAGQVHTSSGSWALEGCGEECFLWIKQKNDWVDETSAPTSKLMSDVFQVPENVTKLLGSFHTFIKNISLIHKFLQDEGLSDTTTNVTYSVMIWYTPQFRAQFSDEGDMNKFVDLMFKFTNQGYINSNIPVRTVKGMHLVFSKVHLNRFVLQSRELSSTQHLWI